MKAKRNTDLKGKLSMDSSFFALIDDAYREFQQAPTRHAVCDCCMHPKIRRDFFNHDQRRLPFHYLQDWFFAAADDPMPQSSWRFVLPRILEALASGEEPSAMGIEVSLDRFETGNPKNWSSGEWRVLDQFQRKLLSLDSYGDNNCLDDVLCMFARSGWNAEELFAQVLDWPTSKLVSRLWNDWCRCGHSSIWITAFWTDSTVPLTFYTSEKLSSRITNYALDSNTPRDMAVKAMSVSDVMLRTCK